MKTQTSLRTSLLTITIGASLALVACGGGETADDNTDITDEPDVDAPPSADAAPPDAPPVEALLSELDADGLIAFCEGVTADPDISEGLGNVQCVGEDCAVSATAVEDCAAKTPAEPIDCTGIVAEDPFATCDQPVSDGEACFGALFSQFTLYAAPTCANVDGLPSPDGLFDPSGHPECDTLVAECPELFQ